MMKHFAIITLILMFWCNQSHHHVFLFMSTSPLGLATEEFIPEAAEAPIDTDGLSTASPPQEFVVGSQNDKSDSVNPDKISQSSYQGDVHKKSVDSSTDSVPVSLDPQVQTESSLPSPAHDSVPVTESLKTPPPDHSTGTRDNLPPPTIPISSQQNSDDLNNSETQSDASSTDFVLKGGEHDEKNYTNSDQQEPASSGTLESHVEDSPPIPPKAEEPIPSFMEWTQQKLHESNLAQAITGAGQTNGHNGHKTSNTANSQQNKSSQVGIQATDVKDRKESNAKNFASPDCGAKVIQSHSESQFANAVLSSSHDEYMLNKCGIPIWFVVELCEPLKIEKVSLGNLELFSSSPKDIEIGISDRYPTRDWTKLGPFTLPDVRAIHSINFPAANASTFGKFLKVNILSHYGTEHYCPLSLVRVNGISEYEVLESENTHPEDIDAVEKEESAVYEEPVADEQEVEKKIVNDKSVFGSAKDAVINIVKKATQVFGKSGSSKDASQSAGLNNEESCRSLIQCLPNYEAHLKERVQLLLSCNFSDLLPFLSKNSPWCGWDYCHALFNKHSIGLPWQPEGFYASIFGGPSVLHALCNYHKPLSKSSCDANLLSNESATSNDPILPDDYNNKSLKSPPLTIELGSSVHESSNSNVDKTVKPVSETTDEKENGKAEGKDAVADVPKEQQQPNTPEVGQPQQTIKEGEATIQPTTTTNGNNNNNGDGNQQTVTSQQSSMQTPDSTGYSEDTSQSSSTQQQSPSQNNNNYQQQQQQPPSNQQQQKESVFVRLSNRIKTLERNSTLTAAYLEELSRRFKKQNEENSQFNEGGRRFINESRTKFKTLEDLYKFELRSLRRNTDEIRERLFNVQLQRSVLILLCLLQFLGIVTACFWFKKRFRQLEEKLESGANTAQRKPSLVVPVKARSPLRPSSAETQQQSVLLGRKRVNSDGSVASSLSSFDKSKKIKRKKKKLADLKPVNIKAMGPSSAPIEYPPGSKQEDVFKFEYPTSATSNSAYNLSSYSNFKENIKPEPNAESKVVPESQSQTTSSFSSQLENNGRVTLLPTKVDSPFTLLSSTTSFYPDPVVSTSSRFALLASPGPGITKSTNLKRSGSLSSIDQSSVSSYGDKTGINSVINGHGDNQSQGSNGSGKKRRNKGLKAFMPKLFDR